MVELAKTYWPLILIFLNLGAVIGFFLKGSGFMDKFVKKEECELHRAHISELYDEIFKNISNNLNSLKQDVSDIKRIAISSFK